MIEIFNNCVTKQYINRKIHNYHCTWLNVPFANCINFDIQPYNLSDFHQKIALAKACEAIVNSQTLKVNRAAAKFHVYTAVLSVHFQL